MPHSDHLRSHSFPSSFPGPVPGTWVARRRTSLLQAGARFATSLALAPLANERTYGGAAVDCLHLSREQDQRQHTCPAAVSFTEPGGLAGTYRDTRRTSRPPPSDRIILKRHRSHRATMATQTDGQGNSRARYAFSAASEKASGSHGLSGQRYMPSGCASRQRNIFHGTTACSRRKCRERPAPISAETVVPSGCIQL